MKHVGLNISSFQRIKYVGLIDNIFWKMNHVRLNYKSVQSISMKHVVLKDGRFQKNEAFSS